MHRAHLRFPLFSARRRSPCHAHAHSTPLSDSTPDEVDMTTNHPPPVNKTPSSVPMPHIRSLIFSCRSTEPLPMFFESYYFNLNGLNFKSNLLTGVFSHLNPSLCLFDAFRPMDWCFLRSWLPSQTLAASWRRVKVEF